MEDDGETLRDLQLFVKDAEVRMGHINDTVQTKCFILTEEMGELYKAIRIKLNMRAHSKTEKFNLEDELADCLYLLIAIANRFNIDLAQALVNKIKKDNSKLYKTREG